jgi:hypothetical protein
VDEEFRQIINADASVNSMRAAFRKSGWPSLFDDGLKKIKQGITSIEEVLRVTEVADAAESPSDIPQNQPEEHMIEAENETVYAIES